MSSGDLAVSVEGLVIRYGDRVAVDGLSLSVAHGEIVALIGPNGAGKTSTVEAIEGYRTPAEGVVRVLGEDVRWGGPALRARVGVMLQDGGLEPRASPRDLVRLYAALHVDAEDPDLLLDSLGLAAVGGSRVRRLSGGERQRLALALALVGRPELLILDEPTAGLDPAARRATRERIAGLRDRGLAILLTTHDLGDVEALADRVVVIDRGRVVASGTPASIGPAGDERTRRVEASFEASLDAAGEATRDVTDLRRALSEAAAEHGFRLAGLREAGPVSLEERYLALTHDRDVEHLA